MKQTISLQLRQLQKLRAPVEALIGLDDLDPNLIDRLLEEAKLRIIEYKQSNPKSKGGNYLFTAAFHNLVQEFKTEYKNTELIPTFLTTKEQTRPTQSEPNQNTFRTQYNPLIKRKIQSELNEFKSEEPKSIDSCFAENLNELLQNMNSKQQQIVDFVLEAQKDYINSLNPLDLKPLTQQDISKHTKIEASMISNYLKHLTVSFSENNVHYVKEFVTGKHFESIQTQYFLHLLKKEKAYYDGDWKLHDHELGFAIEDRFGITVARRSIAKHRQTLDERSAINQNILEDKLYEEIYHELDYMKYNPALCKEKKWRLTYFQFAKIFSKEYETNVPVELVERVIEHYTFSENGPELKE